MSMCRELRAVRHRSGLLSWKRRLTIFVLIQTDASKSCPIVARTCGSLSFQIHLL
jgi:hypothetical protein